MGEHGHERDVIPLTVTPEEELSSVSFDVERHEVVLLDQRRLPTELVYNRYQSPGQVAHAICDMVVRGAPAIGLSAAYALAQQAHLERGDERTFLKVVASVARSLGSTRPTAVNLSWAIQRMLRIATRVAALAGQERYSALLREAESMQREDVASCRAMSSLGAAQVPDGATILTHCNAGALATGGYGTALGVIRAAHEQGKRVRVLADETRPYLQGARLTAWELARNRIPVEVITDSMAAHFFQRGEIDWVVVGSDRIARNGDVANKIGTYGIAVLARAHEVPFTVAAPWSTVDLGTPTGAEIPIEERSHEEVAQIGGMTIVGAGIGVRHPAFDVTPARLVDWVFTERGAFSPRKGELPEMLLA